MQPLQDQKILLGITGGIASYKSATLARRLIDAGAEVRVVMTAGAQAFITPLTFQALTGNPVHTDLLDPAAEAAMGHIELARWADRILLAPASAHTLAKLAHGLADDLLSALCLATDAPLTVAPAMNRLMWAHPATVDNCRILRDRGVTFLGPDDGLQACGETGAGRMLEPDDIVSELGRTGSTAAGDTTAGHLATTSYAATNGSAADGPTAELPRDVETTHSRTLRGQRILITAGPTEEAIDPVRFISNRSSGKMGFEIARAAAAQGASVTLIAGPVNLDTPAEVTRIDVTTATEMLDAVMKLVDEADVFISVAAVSDYRTTEAAVDKIKKSDATIELSLTRNPDILKTVAARPNRPFCVGFAAETEQLEKHALQKLAHKKLDMIAANQVAQAANPVFGTDHNALEVFWPGGHSNIGPASKASVAEGLLTLLAARMQSTKAPRNITRDGPGAAMESTDAS